MNMADSTDYVVMAGNSTANAKAAVVWRKIAEYNYHSEPGQWVYMEADGNRYELPQLDNLTLVPYDDGVLAIGTVNGNFTYIYQSRDNGITWKKNKYYQLPNDFDTSTTLCRHIRRCEYLALRRSKRRSMARQTQQTGVVKERNYL